MISTMVLKFKKPIKILLIILLWVGIWEALAFIINKPLLFPTPIAVMAKLFNLILTKVFWINTVYSFGRVGIGIVIAMALGFIFGLICSFSKFAYEIIYPLVTVIKSTPVASFIILIWIFIGNDSTPIVISSLMVFPIVFSNIYRGMESVDTGLIEVCKIYNISKKKMISSLYVPSVLPYFSSALLSSIGLGWKAGIAAEVLCTPKKSIGLAIFEAKTYIEYVELFAWTVAVVVFSIVLEFLLTKLIKLLFKKYLILNGEKNGNQELK